MSKCGKRAILIGAGDVSGVCFTDRKKEREGKATIPVEEEDMVIALDGGLVHCDKVGICPDYIIGDFDSLPQESVGMLAKYPQEHIMRLPCEKDDTDMLAAIKFAADRGVRDFVIYGGLGGRLSHTIANIQCLMYLKEHGMKGVLLGVGTKAFLLQNETYQFDKEERGYISIFAYSQCASGITLKNLKYVLEDAVLTSAFPLGVSNEFLYGKAAEISVKDGALLVVLDR